MKIRVDMHTHTLSSGHAYSTIDENMRAAAEKGMKMIAMTDHTPAMPGGAHAFHFANLKALPREMYGVRLLKGAETNIINYDGNIDLEEDVLTGLDMVIASLHPPCIDFADEKTMTACIEKAMESPYINIIGHPGDNRYPLDYERIVKKSLETGTLLEVNNASLKPGSFRPGVRENLMIMLDLCKKLGVPIILGTDAHFYTEIGAFDESIQLLKELEFPEELIMNLHMERLLKHIEQKRLK